MKSANNYDKSAESIRTSTGLDGWPDEDIATVQDDGQTDINVIARNALKGQPIPVRDLQPLTDTEYYTDISSYSDALRKTAALQASFMKLPPKVREKFANDPNAAQAAFAGMTPEQLIKEIETWQTTTANRSTSEGQDPPKTPPTQQSTSSGDSRAPEGESRSPK